MTLAIFPARATWPVLAVTGPLAAESAPCRRAQIDVIWTVADVTELDLATAQIGGSMRGGGDRL